MMKADRIFKNNWREFKDSELCQLAVSYSVDLSGVVETIDVDKYLIRDKATLISRIENRYQDLLKERAIQISNNSYRIAWIAIVISVLSILSHILIAIFTA